MTNRLQFLVGLWLVGAACLGLAHAASQVDRGSSGADQAGENRQEVSTQQTPPSAGAAPQGAQSAGPSGAMNPSPPRPRRLEPLPPDARVIQFEFVTSPWEKVLEWFAEVSGLALQMEGRPTGTFSYVRDPNKYTPAEAMDILNSALMPQGYYLVRKGNFLRVVSLEQGVPADLIPRVAPEELDQRGQTELVSVVFPLEGVSAEAVAEEVQHLKSEYGRVVALKSVNALLVTDAAGNARLIRDFVEKLTRGEGAVQVKFRAFQLRYAVARNVEGIVRDLLGLPPRQQPQEANPLQALMAMGRRGRGRFEGGFFPQGSGVPGGPPGGTPGQPGWPAQPQPQQQQPTRPPEVATSVDDYTNTLFVAAPPEKLAQVEEIIRLLDVPQDRSSQDRQTPVLRVYRLSDGSAQSLVDALEAIYAENPSVRFSADESNNAVVAIAPPAEHERIQHLVDEFEQGQRESAVVQLNYLDAQATAELLDALYSSGERDWRGNPIRRAGQPRIEADVSRNRLVIRGSRKQLQDIRQILAALGEYQAIAATGQSGERVRVIPLDGVNAVQLAERLRQVWQRPNPIRIIMPGRQEQTPSSSEQPSASPNGKKTPFGSAPTGTDASIWPTGSSVVRLVRFRQTQDADSEQEAGTKQEPASPMQSSVRGGNQEGRQKNEPEAKQAPREGLAPQERRAQEQQLPKLPPNVVMYPGTNSLVIASDDPEALEEAYRLLQALAQQQQAGPQFVVVPLKYAEASQAAQVLEQLLTETTDEQQPFYVPYFFWWEREREQPKRRSLKIVPEPRTNSIILTGSPAAVERARMLIEQVLDREDLPLSVQRPRLIPVRYADAQQIAQVIRDVYAAYLSTPTQPAGQSTPVAIFPFGGFPRRSGSGSNRSSGGSATPRLAVGVDTKSNHIIVSCSEPLFREIEELVRSLDQAAVANQQAVRIVAVRSGTPSQLKAALLGLQGISTQQGGPQPGPQARQEGRSEGREQRRGERREGDRGNGEGRIFFRGD
jgi:type II secretory pathway component GspD/PulD (secretin)